MSNRSALSVAAVLASILAGSGLISVTDIRAQAAADNCLTAPKDKTPAGGHWYYRLERGTTRQCWYLRDENDQIVDQGMVAIPKLDFRVEDTWYVAGMRSSGWQPALRSRGS